MGWFDRGNDDDDSFQEEVQELASTSGTRRTDGDCDECGEVRGSVILLKSSGQQLCTACFNDPDVYEEHA